MQEIIVDNNCLTIIGLLFQYPIWMSEVFSFFKVWPLATLFDDMRLKFIIC